MKKRIGKQMITATAAAVMMCLPVVSNVHASDSLIDQAKAVSIVQGQNYAGELGENGAKDDTETYTFTLDSASEVTIDQNVRKKETHMRHCITKRATRYADSPTATCT